MEPYARMLDKKKKPTEAVIDKYLGPESAVRLHAFEDALAARYDLEKEMKFPFGNNYGWGYKYTHGRKHLCYAFFEEGAFTVTLQLGDPIVPTIEAALPGMLDQTKALWENRYPCGEHGGWIHYRVLSDAEMNDVVTLITMKVKPAKSV